MAFPRHIGDRTRRGVLASRVGRMRVERALPRRERLPLLHPRAMRRVALSTGATRTMTKSMRDSEIQKWVQLVFTRPPIDVEGVLGVGPTSPESTSNWMTAFFENARAHLDGIDTSRLLIGLKFLMYPERSSYAVDALDPCVPADARLRYVRSIRSFYEAVFGRAKSSPNAESEPDEDLAALREECSQFFLQFPIVTFFRTDAPTPDPETSSAALDMLVDLALSKSDLFSYSALQGLHDHAFLPGAAQAAIGLLVRLPLRGVALAPDSARVLLRVCWLVLSSH